MYVVALIDISLVGDSVKSKALSLLSTEEAERYERFHHMTDANLFLFGRYLTRHLVAHLSGRQLKDIDILIDGTATKPYESHRLIEFSISHSGNFAVVAVSKRPVGVDLQVHDQTQTDMFDRFFTAREREYAHRSFENFYRLWTSVESLAKITGLGFNEAIMRRVPHFKDELNSYTFDRANYYIHSLAQTSSHTLSVITPENVVFKERPSKEVRALTGIDVNELPVDVYSGNVDSDV